MGALFNNDDKKDILREVYDLHAVVEGIQNQHTAKIKNLYENQTQIYKMIVDNQKSITNHHQDQTTQE